MEEEVFNGGREGGLHIETKSYRLPCIAGPGLLNDYEGTSSFPD